MNASAGKLAALLALGLAFAPALGSAAPPSEEATSEVSSGEGSGSEEASELTAEAGASGVSVEVSADGDETKAARIISEVLGEKLPDVAERIATAMESKAKKEEAAFARLSDQQVYEIMKARESSGEPPMVAIVAPIGFFIMVLGIVALVFFFRGRSEERRHETIRMAVDRGMEIPSELLLPKGARRSDLRRGLVLSFGGMGLAIAMASSESDGSWAVAVFPLMIGVGYLAFWWLDRLGWDGPGRGIRY